MRASVIKFKFSKKIFYAEKKDKKHFLYSNWKSIINRCYNEKHVSYKHIGKKGIKLSRRWFNFKHFANDMADKPEGTILSRIKNAKIFSRETCEWTTRSNHERKNVKIKKNAILVIYKRKIYQLSKLARMLKMKYNYFRNYFRENGFQISQNELKILIKNYQI